MIVLDTHVWVWAMGDRSHLSKAAHKAFLDAKIKSNVCVSSISVWEVAMLVKRGRLQLSMDMDEWLSHCQKLSFLSFIPVDNEIATKSVSLPPPLHADRADRIIAATALGLNATLVTKDEKLLAYRLIKTLW